MVVAIREYGLPPARGLRGEYRHRRNRPAGDEAMTMTHANLRSAMLLLLLLTASSGGIAQEKQDDKATAEIDCSAFHKESYGYLVTTTTRIATPPLDVTVPKGMPIRRGEKAAAVQGKDLAEVIDQNCAS